MLVYVSQEKQARLSEKETWNPLKGLSSHSEKGEPGAFRFETKVNPGERPGPS